MCGGSCSREYKGEPRDAEPEVAATHEPEPEMPVEVRDESQSADAVLKNGSVIYVSSTGKWCIMSWLGNWYKVHVDPFKVEE